MITVVETFVAIIVVFPRPPLEPPLPVGIPDTLLTGVEVMVVVVLMYVYTTGLPEGPPPVPPPDDRVVAPLFMLE